MERTVMKLKSWGAVITLALTPVVSMAFDQDTSGLPPKAEFSNLSASEKSNVCGYLLVGLSIAGQRLHVKAGGAPEDVPDKVLATALGGVLHLTSAASVPVGRKHELELLAQRIEALDAKTHTEIAQQCGEEVKNKVDDKKFIKQQLSDALEIAQQQLVFVGQLEKEKLEKQKQ